MTEKPTSENAQPTQNKYDMWKTPNPPASLEKEKWGKPENKEKEER